MPTMKIAMAPSVTVERQPIDSTSRASTGAASQAAAFPAFISPVARPRLASNHLMIAAGNAAPEPTLSPNDITRLAA